MGAAEAGEIGQRLHVERLVQAPAHLSENSVDRSGARVSRSRRSS
jgi:hypothetical protein